MMSVPYQPWTPPHVTGTEDILYLTSCCELSKLWAEWDTEALWWTTRQTTSSCLMVRITWQISVNAVLKLNLIIPDELKVTVLTSVRWHRQPALWTLHLPVWTRALVGAFICYFNPPNGQSYSSIWAEKIKSPDIHSVPKKCCLFLPFCPVLTEQNHFIPQVYGQGRSPQKHVAICQANNQMSWFYLFYVKIQTQYVVISLDSQFTVMLTELLRPPTPSHQNNPLLSLVASKDQLLDVSGQTAPPGGGHGVLWSTVVMFGWTGESCFSSHPLGDVGHCTEKLSPLKICLVLGVNVSEGGASSVEREKRVGTILCWLFAPG